MLSFETCAICSTFWFILASSHILYVSAQCWICIHLVSLPHSDLLYNQVSVSVLFPDTNRMELNNVLLELRSVSFNHGSQLFALLCLIVITYKSMVLLARRRRMLSILEVFPGPPAYCFFGNVLEVKYIFVIIYSCILWFFF